MANKYWFPCGQTAEEGYCVPMQLTVREAGFIATFIADMSAKNHTASWCGSTYIDMNHKFNTEDECWEHIWNENYE